MDIATENIIAEKIRAYPHTEMKTFDTPVGTSPESWATATVEAGKHADMAAYLHELAWFYSAARPTNALDSLIAAKLNILPRGGATGAFKKELKVWIEEAGGSI
ncbi:hypothetical protein DSS3P8_186 [Roseobacter phage DSS3P8]|nr:hypothetical protein DSS3P8_186 [Roseobacter phage DSS3P8]